MRATTEAELDEWEAIEQRTVERARTLSAVMLAQRFNEAAVCVARNAEAELLRAAEKAERARQMLERTTATLEAAIRLHAMGRL